MPTTPENTSPDNDAPEPSLLAGVSVDELFARGMQSVRMTGGGSMQNWEPPTLEEAGRLFPNYQILDVLGRGGMGVVYKAVQKALDRVVAIKLLPLEISIDRDFADRFVREARTMAKLNHPNIVSVYDFGTTPEGHLYFVMEFVEGTTLHHLIKSTGLKPSQALELIVNICEALQYAHTEGVVHRDIKPANVLVDTKGRVKVADFGLARVDAPTAEQWGQTMTGMVLGTPDYMAPEQKSGSRVDHRADIYSLGVMLYEMLCGQVPQGVFDPPSQRVSVDERIDQVVIRAMQQEPDRRYPNTGEMKSAVENIRLTPLPKAAAPGKKAAVAPSPARQAETAPSSSPETRRESSITPWLAGIAAVCALVAVSVVIIQMKRPNRETAVQTVPPPAPELAPVKSATPAPVPSANTPAEKPEPVIAKAETTAESHPGKNEAETPIAALPPKIGEPPAPVSLPPSEPPVAVATVPGPARVEQIIPPPVGTSSVEPAPRPASPVPIAPPPAETPAPPSTDPSADWHALVNRGDVLLAQHQRDDALQAYLDAFDLVTDGRPVSPADVEHLCKKLATYQMTFGSRAEARQTLEQGRQTLKKMTAAKDPVERQKSIEQIENAIRALPRD